MKRFFDWLKNDERGQGMVEYALIIALVSVVAIAILFALGGSVTDVFEKADDALTTTGAINIMPSA